MGGPDGKQQPGFADPLLGEPVGETIGRDNIDGLEVSAKREKRPTGVSRAQYLESMPGENTANFMVDAGIKRRARLRWLAIACLLLIGAAGAAIWVFGGSPPPG